MTANTRRVSRRPLGKGGADACKRVEKLADSKGQLADAVAKSMSEEQRRVIVKNRAVALLHSNHLDKCRESLAALKALPGDEGAVAAALVEAALYMRERKPEKAEALLSAGPPSNSHTTRIRARLKA